MCSFNTPERVSCAAWIEHASEGALLVTGSGTSFYFYHGLIFVDDDVVTVYNVHGARHAYVTSWSGFIEALPTRSKPGLTMDWCPWRRELVLAGNSRLVKIWDLEKGQCTNEMATRSQSCVVSVVKDKIGGDLVVAGCDDGSVRVLDRRLPSRERYASIIVEN